MRYICYVMKIKPERVQDYINVHKKLSKDILQDHRAAGITDEFLFVKRNEVILFIFGNNPEKSMTILGKQKALSAWASEVIYPMLEEYPNIIKDEQIKTLSCIFDLNEQLAKYVDNI